MDGSGLSLTRNSTTVPQ